MLGFASLGEVALAGIPNSGGDDGGGALHNFPFIANVGTLMKRG